MSNNIEILTIIKNEPIKIIKLVEQILLTLLF